MDPLQDRLTKILEAANWDSDEDETFFAEIDEIKQNAISEFTFDRLRSYYLENTSAYVPVKARLSEAKDLKGVSPSASLVFSISAAEICLKSLILRPMVHGFIHQAYVAQLIANLAVSHMGWDRFKELLEAILRDKLGIDLSTATVRGANKRLWSELTRLVKTRNDIMHKGSCTTDQEATSAIEVAEEFCETIFPQLLNNFSLTVDEHGSIVEQHNIPGLTK